MIPSSSSGNSWKSKTSSRPDSRASQSRPGSSASTTRPVSRSSRPKSRHAQMNQARLLPLCDALVRQALPGLIEEDEEKHRNLRDYVVQHVESTTMNKGAIGIEMDQAEKILLGHIQKAQIRSQDSLSEALETVLGQLKMQVSKDHDIDDDIKPAKVPSHLQFILALSNAPAPSTLTQADIFLHDLANPPKPAKGLTWESIMDEDPFEGDHWDGVLNKPSGSDSSLSSPYLSPLSSPDIPPEPLPASAPTSPEHDLDDLITPLENEHLKERPSYASYAHRKEVEDLQARQYWRSDWEMPEPLPLRFDLGDVSSLGPTVRKVMGHGTNALPTELLLLQERYIYEHDAVREVLFAFQGRSNIMLEWNGGKYQVVVNPPRLRHLSLSAQTSVLTSLSTTATHVRVLRGFTELILDRSGYLSHRPRLSRMTRTMEAFADALSTETRAFDAWCAHREELHCSTSPPVVVSLLSTLNAVQHDWSRIFRALLSTLEAVFPSETVDGGLKWQLPAFSPSAITAKLLDSLFSSTQVQEERGGRDNVASALLRVFIRTAEPVWHMMGKWLKDGMNVTTSEGHDELEEEFFIACHGLGGGIMGMGLLDPDFWAEGYTLRYSLSNVHDDDYDDSDFDLDADEQRGIPAFLAHVVEPVLGSGKGLGLLKVLGIDNDRHLLWKSFRDLVGAQNSVVDLFSVSVDTLSSLIFDELDPFCQAVGTRLVKAINEECDLWPHITAIEDLFFMRRGDALSHFCDILFAKVQMDAQQNWTDFHSLNAMFNDVVTSDRNVGSREWIRPSLVRFSYRPNSSLVREGPNARTVKGLDGLLLDYAVPFPLTYIFTPTAVLTYARIFTFLLQIRRAKSSLERVLINRGDKDSAMKFFYAIRGRLSWFINMLLTFLTTHVLHTETAQFHKAIKEANSLDAMIAIHNNHLNRLQKRCLLDSDSEALHNSILTILDMAQHFTDAFIAVSGETTSHDVSQNISLKHRSRRLRRQRRNVISFSQEHDIEEDSSSSSDSDYDGQHASLVDASSFSMAADNDELDLGQRIDKMTRELDALVRFLRRGTESIAGSASEAASTFGVLAFALEDWDL